MLNINFICQQLGSLTNNVRKEVRKTGSHNSPKSYLKVNKIGALRPVGVTVTENVRGVVSLAPESLGLFQQTSHLLDFLGGSR